MKNLLILFVWDPECSVHSKVKNYKRIIHSTSLVLNQILGNEKIDVLTSPKVKEETILISITECLSDRYKLNLNIPVVVDKPICLIKDSQGLSKREVYIVFVVPEEARTFVTNPVSGNMAILELEMGMWNTITVN
jgi:hypothetical protein